MSVELDSRGGEYEDIRYELSGDGIAKITIDRPEVRNAFRPQTVIEISDALEARARGPDGRRDRPHRRGAGRVLLGRRPARARRHRLPRGPSGATRRALPRHRPARADPPAAQAGRGDGRRLRDRRRPRAAPRLRPDDRRRQRALRPDRARASARSTAASARACWPTWSGPRRPRRSGSCAASTTPAGARDGAGQHRRAARAPRGGDRRSGAARCSRSRPSRCGS